MKEEDHINDSLTCDNTDESIVHDAVEVLRRRVIEHTDKHDHEYFSADEMSLESQKRFVDPLLYKTVCWLFNKNDFENAEDVPDERLDSKCISIACDLTTLVTSAYSPKHLGLAVHMHNEFGSRHLIDDLYNLGHCASYRELRRFLSSTAEFAITTNTTTASGGVVPSNIASRSEGGKLIVGVADNWDHNERTVDGKRTTHAMTSILVSPECHSEPLPRIPRTGNTTFNRNLIPGGSACCVVPYKKPAIRPCPTFNPPVNIAEIRPTETSDVKVARMKELLYNIGRCSIFYEDISENTDEFPVWRLFQQSTHIDTVPDVSSVAYNPIIMANPTDYSTVYTVLLRLKECINALGQKHAPIFFDMGLLSKALEIVWCGGDELKGVIPCEGGMHLLMAVFAGIGKLYGDAGLHQLLTESGVYASATVSNILAGKDFDRALTAFQLVDEALHACLLAQFEKWCTENDKEIHTDVHSLLRLLRDDKRKDERDININKWCDIAPLHIVPLLDEFREEGRQKSPTFKLWDEYLTKVSAPLKMFLLSTRSPNWSIHQHAKLSLMPLLFASNRTTYARYMTAQILQMNRLPDDVQDSFMAGLFTAKIAEGTFNNVWLDYTLEATENKDLKGSGGIIGLTLKEDALVRWFLSRPIASRYSSEFHKGISSAKQRQHAYHSNSKNENYDKGVKKLVSMFGTTFVDPFDIDRAPDRLINFATGVTASEEVEISMTSCLEKGTEVFEAFVKDRLVIDNEGETPSKSFYSPLNRCNIKTMTDMKKGGKIVKKSKAAISGETMYQRLLAVNSWKKVPLERVFSYENTSVPMSMFSEDGKMLKGKKSDFMVKLEGLLEDKTTTIDRADTIIFDGMAVIQSLPVQNQYVTFNDMAKAFLDYIVMKARSTSCVSSIHILFDKYNADSIKSQTRKGRGNTSVQSIIHIHEGLNIPNDWKSFLCHGENKERLAEFYTGYISENARNILHSDEKLFLSGGLGNKCILVTCDTRSDINELSSNQEEADTRIILHAQYATQNGSDTIIVVSPDTDVLVLLTHHRLAIGTRRIFMSTGRTGLHTDTRRFIPVHSIFEKLSEEQHRILMSVYCLTGCDTTSSFYGKGKKTVFKAFFENAHNYQALADLGKNTTMSATDEKTCTTFVCSLYGGRGCSSLNELRCAKAMKSVHPRCLPPTENSFHLHCLRCTLQLWIWHHATTSEHDLPPIDNLGYTIGVPTEGAEPVMMSQPVAAPELLNDVVCQCDICCETCSCFQNEQPCTHACSCENLGTDSMCTNMYSLISQYSRDMDNDNNSENDD